MATLNSLQNVVAAKNVGIGTTYFDPRIIKGVILCPKGYKISSTIAASTLQAQMLADASNNAKSQRIYPIGNLLEFKDNSEKAVEQNYGYGGKAVVRDGAYTWQFMFIKGGLSLQQALRNFNGANWDFLFVDAKNQLIGTNYVDTNGVSYIMAIPSIQFYAAPFGLNDGKKNAEYMLDFSFFPNYVNEQIEFISDASFFILDTIKGLIDINLSGAGSATPGTYNLIAKDNLAVNLYQQLQGLAGAGSINWVVTNATTGLVIPVTSVALNANLDSGNGGFDVVLPTGHANYPATGKVNFNLVPAASLNTNNIGGFESAGLFGINKN